MGIISNFLSLKKKPGQISALGVAGASLDGVVTYASERAEDPEGSALVDGAQAVGTAGLWLFAEPLMWGITAGQVAAGAGKMMLQDAQHNRDTRIGIESHVKTGFDGSKSGTLGGNFQDTQQAATMRQRQQNLLRQHRMATESVLGSEARQLHR